MLKFRINFERPFERSRKFLKLSLSFREGFIKPLCKICEDFSKNCNKVFFTDLRNTDLNSEIFLKKLHRAHEALSQSDTNGSCTLKTLSASFGAKWPYKRTMSAPASIVPRPDVKGDFFFPIKLHARWRFY